MTLREQSESVGMSRTYFSTMRCAQKEKYKLFEKLGNGNLAVGHQTFFDEVDRLKNRVIKIYYYFKNPRRFTVWLHDKGIFKSNNSGNITRLDGILFTKNGGYNMSGYIKLKKICEAWDKENQDRLSI